MQWKGGIAYSDVYTLTHSHGIVDSATSYHTDGRHVRVPLYAKSENSRIQTHLFTFYKKKMFSNVNNQKFLIINKNIFLQIINKELEYDLAQTKSRTMDQPGDS